MKDRRALQEELNRVNEAYQKMDLELRKAGGSDAQRQQMRDMLNAKKEQIMSQMGDDLQKVNRGEALKISGGTTAGADIDQTKLPDMAQQKGLGKQGMFKKLGAKLGSRGLKALPIIGTVAGLASAGEAAYAGDYDTAKEELASAADPTGLSDVALMARDIAEAKQDVDQSNAIAKGAIIGKQGYRMSPAYRNARGMGDAEEAEVDMANARQEALKRIRGY